MSASNYPPALDSTANLPDNIGDTAPLNNPDHASLHNVISDAVIAVETKLGTGAATSTSGTVLRGNGIGTSQWAQANLTTDVTGTLPIANGGTGITALGTGVATFLGTPTSANLAAALTDETGSGLAVFGTNPTLTGATIADGTNIVLNTTTGTTIGTATTQKLGFYNATPVVQPANTVDLGTVLSNEGLRASGTAYPITTSGALNLSGTWTNNTVPANALATNAITLGYAQITAAVNGTTLAQVTGLTVTVTIPAGGRKIKITAWTGNLGQSASGDQAIMSVWDGVVGSGTQLTQATFTSGFNGAGFGVATSAVAVVTPAAGSKTYNVGIFNNGGGTATVGAAATSPAFILVEAI